MEKSIVEHSMLFGNYGMHAALQSEQTIEQRQNKDHL